MLRPLRIALVGSLLAAAVIGVPGSGSASASPVAAPAAHAGLGAVLPAAKGTAPAADPTLVVAPQVPVLLAAAENYTFTVHLRNPSDIAIPAGTVQLRIETARIETAADLAAAQKTGSTTSSSGVLLTEVDAPETRAGAERTITLTVPRDQLPLGAASEPGVYVVSAELHVPATGAEGDGAQDPAADPTVSSEAALLDTTAVVWEDAGTGGSASRSLPLTVVVPFVLPEEVEAMPTPEQLAGAMPRFNALLDAADRWRATLAVDPRIIAAIRGYGNAAPAGARDFLDRLRTSVRPMFLLQFADADPAAQAAMGYDALLGPTGLSFVTSAGSFPADTQEPTSAPGSETPGAGTETDGGGGSGSGTGTDGGDPVPPTLDELLDWPTAQAGAWPAPGQVDADTLTLLKRSGITSVVLESGNVTGNRTAGATVGGLDALVSDAGLDSAARAVLSAANDTDRAAGSAELVARLALGAENDPKGMVLALDRGAVADADAPATLFDTLDALEWIRAASAGEQPRGTGALAAGSTKKERIAMLREGVKRSKQIDGLAPLLENPEYLTEYQRVRLLSSFATRYAASGTDLAAVAQARLERDDKLLGGVSAVPSENTQLIGSSSRVPVLLHNALPFDAIVTLRVAPTSATILVPELRFAGQRIAPGANATVLVPIESRVSSGDAALSLQVADDADDAVFSSDLLRLTIRSSYEAIMLSVLGVLAALLFGFGIWRSVRRHRPDRAEAGTAAGGTAGTGSADPATDPAQE